MLILYLFLACPSLTSLTTPNFWVQSSPPLQRPIRTYQFPLSLNKDQHLLSTTLKPLVSGCTPFPEDYISLHVYTPSCIFLHPPTIAPTAVDINLPWQDPLSSSSFGPYISLAQHPTGKSFCQWILPCYPPWRKMSNLVVILIIYLHGKGQEEREEYGWRRENKRKDIAKSENSDLLKDGEYHPE